MSSVTSSTRVIGDSAQAALQLQARAVLHYLPWGFFGWLLTGAAVELVGPSLLITALRPVLPEDFLARLGIALACLAAGVAVFCGCLHLALLRLGSRQQLQEDAADAFAKIQGYPVTIAIASMLQRHERRPDGRPASQPTLATVPPTPLPL